MTFLLTNFQCARPFIHMQTLKAIKLMNIKLSNCNSLTRQGFSFEARHPWDHIFPKQIKLFDKSTKTKDEQFKIYARIYTHLHSTLK